LLHVFPTFRVGGAQMRFAALANHFGPEFRHTIVALDGQYDCRERLDPSLRLSFQRMDFRKRDTLGNVRRFRALLKSVSPSRLVTYNWGSIECAMANWPGRVPHIHIEDGFGPEEAHGQIGRRVLMRRFVLSRSTVVLPSRTLHRLALDAWKLKPVRLRYIPNGIDCARFGGAGIVPYDWPGTSPVVGTVAALRAEKNLMRLVEAFHRVRQKMVCRLLVAGDGPERPGLEARVAELRLTSDVRFTGHVTDTERVYAAMSVFALSSDTEQMPTSVLEAMATGLPVAATDVGDVSGMVAAENRPYVTTPDPAPLGKAILDLVGDAALRARIGAANRAVARESFDQDAMFAAYGSLFR
jgi:glycosyltransferase involved in cell wall biosynthesis